MRVDGLTYCRKAGKGLLDVKVIVLAFTVEELGDVDHVGFQRTVCEVIRQVDATKRTR